MTPELRQLRYFFVAVADRRSFSRAAADLFVAQQAVSRQIGALERSLGITLLRRTSRRVELTPAGAVFLADCRRILADADQAVRRVQAAARGEAGSLRLAYTLTTAYHTVPALLAALAERYSQLTVEAQEVFAGDIPRLFDDDAHDVAIAPAASYPAGLTQQIVRHEALCLAVGEHHRLAACRAAGLEPELDEHAAGATVWGFIAQGRGVGIVVGSLAEQLPRGVHLVDIEPPPAPLAVAVVYPTGSSSAAPPRLLDTAAELFAEPPAIHPRGL